MKLKLTYIIILSSLLFTACKDVLETSPTDSVADSEIYKNTDNITTVINGTWGYLNDTYFTYANPGYSAFMRTSDAMGSDVAVTTKYGYRDPYAFTELSNATSNRVNYFWTMLYKVIDNANNVIARVDAAEGSQESKDLLKGQAKTLRAFSYLNLASFYQFSYLKDKDALTAPIYTQPTTTETTGNSKASLEEIYQLVITDLKDAATLLADYERAGNEKYKIDAHVANGLLARAYLNTGEWLLAAESAKKARDGYGLMSSAAYLEGFNDNQNEEWIWGHLQTNEQSVASYTFHFLDVSSPGSYYYSFMADPYFKDLFSSADIRSQLFEWDGTTGREGFLRYKKFKFKPNLIGDIVYMRSSEMLLIEAEGYARSTQTGDAIKALNELRTARKADLYVATAGKDLLAEILVERRKELWGEGFALTDILRTQGSVQRKSFLQADGTPIKVTVITPDGSSKQVNGQGHRVIKFPDGKSFEPNSAFYLFAIPQKEIDHNPNL